MLPALHNMGLACIHERQWTRAASYINQALRLDPEDHGVRRLRLLLRLHRAYQGARSMLGRR
jgi:regulator of sirC expression with transglutaminase-like and TPR domain